MSKNFKSYLFQIILWLAYYGLEFYVEILNHIFTKTSIIRYFLGVTLIYISVNVLSKKGRFKLYGQVFAILIGFILISFFLKYETFNLFQKFSNPPIKVQFFYIIDNFARLFGIAFIYSLYLKLLEKQGQAICTENQLFAMETNYLNSKIDSHFFLNSLNIFYARYLKNNSRAVKKIIQLSNFVKQNQ